MCSIQFLDPNHRIEGKERRSKLLDPTSALYQWLDQQKEKLQQRYPYAIDNRMDFHMELVKKGEICTDQLLTTRSSTYEGTVVQQLECLKAWNNALVIECPDLPEVKGLHITMAYFPKGVPGDAISFIQH